MFVLAVITTILSKVPDYTFYNLRKIEIESQYLLSRYFIGQI